MFSPPIIFLVLIHPSSYMWLWYQLLLKTCIVCLHLNSITLHHDCITWSARAHSLAVTLIGYGCTSTTDRGGRGNIEGVLTVETPDNGGHGL